MQAQPNNPLSPALLQTLVLALTDMPDLRSALSALVSQTCLHAGWNYGEAWAVEGTQAGEQEHLRAVADWHTSTLSFESFAGHSRNRTLGRDDILAGRAWTSGLPVWLKSLSDEPKLRRGQVAVRVGLTAALAIPLLSEGEVVIVLTFFMSTVRDTDEAVANTLTENSPLLGTLVARKTDGMEASADRVIFDQDNDSLNMSEALLSNIVGSAMDAIISVDESQRITLFNEAAEQMFGCPAEEAIGQTLDRFIPIRFQDAHRTHIAELRASDATVRLARAHTMVVGLRATGEEFPLESSVSQTTVGGTKVFTAILRDVTERIEAEDALRAREAAEQASQAKDEFLSRMSHELRTPLNSIIGFADLLNMEGLAPRQLENLGYIRRAGQHLLQLVNEVLDITSIESGSASFSLEPVQLAELMREVVDLVHSLADSHAISIDVASAQPDIYVQADRQRVKQVLLNILSNAIKYNVEGGSVTLNFNPTTDGIMRISITDTGPGIEPEKLSRLFVPFERLGIERRSADAQGTGLGLALAKRLVEAMHGTIGVESTPGKGSTFWIEIPATQAPILAPQDLATSPMDTSDLPGYISTVMYVEDNLSNLRLVERILEHRKGIKLLSCMQGRLAIDIARDQRPDLILLDLHLPDMTGLAVLEALKSDPATQHIPIVIISADTTKGALERLLAAGAYSYLTKPLEVRRFLRVLDDALSGNR